MARILIDGRWIKDSGIGRYVENLTTEVICQDKKNTYIILVKKGESGCLSVQSNRVEYVETDIGWYTPQEQIALPKLLEAQNPDLVHFTNFNIPLSYHKPFVVTIHDLTLLRYKSIKGGLIAPFTYHLKDVVMRHILKTAVKRSRRIFTPSQFVKEDVVGRYHCDPQKIIITNNAADKHIANGHINLNQYGITRPFILCVGNPYPHKNLDRLQKAFAQLTQNKDFNCQLVIVGRDNEFMDRQKKLTKKLKLENRIKYTGYINDVELAGIYKKALLYVFPSLSEGFGIPGLEAMSYGVPVASSNATCLPEIFGKGAVYFDPKNTDMMAQVIGNLALDGTQRKKLVQLGYGQVQKYSWAKSARELVRGYNKALKS